MPSQLNESRGLKSRSGIGGGGAVIRQSAINHAARVASQAATHRTYLNQYQQPDKQSHRSRQQLQQAMTYSSTQPLSPIRHTTQTTDMYPTYTEQEYVEIQDDETHASDCLCTICSCGKHKCPPTPHTSHYDPYLASEHHAQYTPKKTTTQRVVTSMTLPKSVPFQGNSIYQDSFKPHPLSNSRLVRTSAELHDTGVGRNNAPFLGETTNQSAYKRWNAAPAEPAQHMHKWTQLKEDREFQSEYRSQHDKKAIPGTTRGKEPWYIPPSMKFQGDSTSHSDYHAHRDGYPSRSYRPHDYRTWLPDNRDFQSEHSSHYTPKANPICPAGPLSKGVTKSIGHHGHIHVEKQCNGTWKRSQPL